MNAGLSNLKSLRGWLLAPDMENDARFDDQILSVGRGVAAALDQHCNRRFARVAGDTAEFSCDRMHFTLPRYPLEAVTKIEKRAYPAAGFTEQDLPSFPMRLRRGSGLVEFFGVPGSRLDDLRVTWTGGYWFDDSEDESSDMPEGAFAVPPDLQLAWRTQCQFVWQRKDKLGVPLEKTAVDMLAQQPLHPQVVALLQPFKRFAL